MLATNGNYNYGIILFVSVEPAAINDEARVERINTHLYDLPYASDILNAPINSNVGVPGKYVIDMNGKGHAFCNDNNTKWPLILCLYYRESSSFM